MKTALKKIVPVVFVAFLSFIITCAGSSPSSNNSVARTSNNGDVKSKETSGYKTLDQAIKEASERIDKQIVSGTKIAILNFNSSSDQFSVYVLDELTANFLDTRKLIVIDRKEIDLIRGELEFQSSGEVSDDSMQKLGKILGAQTIVSGSLMEIGDTYRIVIRALSVQTATVEVQYRTDIANDNRVRALLASGKSTNGINIRVSNKTSTTNVNASASNNTTAENNRASKASPKRGTLYNTNGHSYELFNQTMGWTEAKRYCERLDGYLATITSTGEQTFIENLLTRDGSKNMYWLGGYTTGGFRYQWVTGEPFTYNNWRQGSGTLTNSHEDKLMIYRVPNPTYGGRFGMWEDDTNDGQESFYQNTGFICEWE
jgi:TolB-like protein